MSFIPLIKNRHIATAIFYTKKISATFNKWRSILVKITSIMSPENFSPILQRRKSMLTFVWRRLCLFWSYNEVGLTNGQSRCVFKRGYLLMTRETVREMKRVTGHSIKWKCDLAWTLSAACMQIKVSLSMDFPSSSALEFIYSLWWT